ncbi:hypothetical protein ABPG72_015206 [Tetrahymena utriculariae]
MSIIMKFFFKSYLCKTTQHIKTPQFSYIFLNYERKQNQSQNIKYNFGSFVRQQDLKSISTINDVLANIDNTKDEQQAVRICKQALEQFKEKSNYDSSLEVCNIGLELSKKLQSDEQIKAFVFFMAKKIEIACKQNNDYEMNQLAKQLYAYYLVSKGQLSVSQRFRLALFLADCVSNVGLLENQNKYLQEASALLQTDSTLEITHNQIYDFYLMHFNFNFQKQGYQEALKYAKMAFNIVDHEIQGQLAQKALICQYLCHKLLKQPQESKQIIENLKQYQSIPDFKLEQIDSISYYPNKKMFSFEIESSNQQENLYNDNEEFFENMKEKRDKFIENNNINEGIKYFEQLIQDLQNKQELLKILFLRECQSFLYYQQNNISKSLEISLKNHQELFSLRNNILHDDQLTQLNIYQIKLFYFMLNDFQKSYDWGQKLESLCKQYNLFNIKNEKLALSLQQQIASLQHLNKMEEALNQCNTTLEYLERFNYSTIIFEVRMMKVDIYTKLNQIEQIIKEIRIVIDQNKVDLSKKSKYTQIYYNALKSVSHRFVLMDDRNNIIFFGKEYLYVRETYEDSIDMIQLRVAILFNLSQQLISEKNYLEAEEVTRKCLQLASTDNEIKDFYIRQVFQYIPLAIKVSKIDEAEEYLKIVQIFYEKEITNLNDKQNALISLIQMQSIILSLKKNFDKSLEFFAKQLVLQQKSKETLTKQQRQILKQLLEDQAYSKQVRELVEKYNVDLNI